MRSVINVSVERVLQRLSAAAIIKAIDAHKIACDGGSTELTTTTIRLKQPVKEFYEALADEMGISLQAAITIMLTTMVNCQLDDEGNLTEVS